jgi:N,N'-diacetyllegionaminate synthase
MVKAIRNIEDSLGSGIKEPALSEIKNLRIARKSIMAKQQIAKGEILSNTNLIVKRPGDGISPMLWDLLVGQIASRDYLPDEMIDQ